MRNLYKNKEYAKNVTVKANIELKSFSQKCK